MSEEKNKELEKKITVSFTVDRELVETAKKKAKEGERSFSGYLSFLMKQDLVKKKA